MIYRVTDHQAGKRGKHFSIYVRAEDLELWRRVEQYAAERRMATSAVVMSALERYLADQDR